MKPSRERIHFFPMCDLLTHLSRSARLTKLCNNCRNRDTPAGFSSVLLARTIKAPVRHLPGPTQIGSARDFDEKPLAREGYPNYRNRKRWKADWRTYGGELFILGLINGPCGASRTRARDRLRRWLAASLRGRVVSRCAAAATPKPSNPPNPGGRLACPVCIQVQ